MTIEDYLDQATFGFINLAENDKKLFHSLWRQTQKGMGLTTRQHTLLKSKLLEYKDELSIKYPGFEENLDFLRRPYREIDRSRKISFKMMRCRTDSWNLMPSGDEPKTLMMEIRFPFSNKMIKHIDFIKKIQDRKIYNNKTKSHFVKVNEYNVYEIVNHFKDLDFEIDPRLMDYYNELKEICDNPSEYEPGVYNYELKNVHPSVEKYATETFGAPDEYNLHLYKDRSLLLGLSHFDSEELDKNSHMTNRVSQTIINREHSEIHLQSNEYALDELIESLHELKRFPLLVVVPNRMTQTEAELFSKGSTRNDVIFKKDHTWGHPVVPDVTILARLHMLLSQYVDNKDMAVLYRKDKKSVEDLEFNNYVTRYELNNLPSKDLKVIFLHQHKRVPKPLIEINWRPTTTLLLKSFGSVNRTMLPYKEQSDLVVTYTDEFSTPRKNKLGSGIL